MLTFCFYSCLFITEFFYYNSFIHTGYFYSTSPSQPLLIGAPDYSIDTVSELQAPTSEGPAQGPYTYMQQLELDNLDSYLRPAGRKALNLPLSHHAPLYTILL